MNTKIMEAIAILQEQVQMKTVEKNELFDKVIVSNFSYSEYPKDGFLKRVSYGAGDTYVFDLQYIDRLGSEVKKSLVGGEGINGSLNLLKNVYGINEDFTVWYIDENGKMYGAGKIVEIPIDPNEIVKASDGLKQGMEKEGDLTVGDVRGRQNLTIDGSKMTEKITNLEELTFFPNLTEITIKNLTLNDISGLQYSPNLQKIWFDNTTSSDYSGLKFCLNTKEFYLINGSVDNDNIKRITDQFAYMTELDIVKIRNNDGLTNIPELATIGGIETLTIEENSNLTNIYGLSTVNDKTSLINLYLNENNLTDVVNTEEKNTTYNYILPRLTDDNIINMSYLDGYVNLSYLDCGKGPVSVGQGCWHEDGTPDIEVRANENLNFILGIDDNGTKKGISSLKKLKTINFEYCNIYNIDELNFFKDLKDRLLFTIKLFGNENFNMAQINFIADLINTSTYTISGKYVTALDSNKPSLNYSGLGITDLSFLDNNQVTTSLNLSLNPSLPDAQVTYIGKMTQLISLNLTGCSSITNFSFLKNLSNLKYLSLALTQIHDEDLLDLSCFDKLLQLNLAQCKNLSDLSVFGKCKNAVYSWGPGSIDVYGWNINETTNLSELNGRGYTTIRLGSGNLTTIQDAISNTVNGSGEGLVLHGKEKLLRQLESCNDITGLRIDSASPDNLKAASFAGNNDSLNLSGCKSLNKVYFRCAGFENLDISGAVSLSNISIYNMLAGKRWILPDFSKNNNLTYLNLERNYLLQSDLEELITDLVPVYELSENSQVLISGAPEISEIILSNNEFSSLEPFSKLAGKTSGDLRLTVANNSLITLTGIENLTQLTSLDISGNNGITNIKPILDLKSKTGNKLTTVTITGCTQITDSQKSELKSAGVKVVE